MKQIKTLLTCILLGAIFMLTSCSTSKSANEKLAGYTLKDKKELLQQNILNCYKKTVIATP